MKSKENNLIVLLLRKCESIKFAVGHTIEKKEGGNEKIRSNNVFLLCYLCNFKGWTKYLTK